MNPLLLCTDLDRTLIPNGSKQESPDASQYFESIVSRPEILLAYVTGRHLASIQGAIEHYQLPVPDFALADVGTSIYQVEGNHWRRWLEWDQQLSVDWPDSTADQMRNKLTALRALRVQEGEKQSRFKVSYYAALDSDIDRVSCDIADCLSELSCRYNIIWSIDEKRAIRLLDLLPPKANKLFAIEYLMQKLNIGLTETLFAGDSGNDLDVFSSEIPSVMVANATEDLKNWISKTPKANVYLASGQLPGMNGYYREGIIEGMMHFWPQTKSWLGPQPFLDRTVD